MKSSCTLHALALVAVGAIGGLSSTPPTAAPNELRALSETEMSSVYGRGLTDATVGALTQQQQSGAYASATSSDLLAAMTSMTADGTRNLDRQLSQQQMQTATVGVQTTIKMAQTLAAASQVLTPVDIVLPTMAFPFLLGLPTLPSLAAINGKH